MLPPELCDDHDVPIDEHGCWVCGHAGPISGVAAPSWDRFVLDSLVRTRIVRKPVRHAHVAPYRPRRDVVSRPS